MPPIAFALVGEQPEVSRFLISAGVEIARYSSLLIFLIGLRNIPGFLAPLIAAGLDMRATDSSTFVASKSLSCLREILSRGAATDKPGHSGIPALVSLCRADKGKTLDRIELLLTHGAGCLIYPKLPSWVYARGWRSGRVTSPISVAAFFENGVHVLRPKGVDITVEREIQNGDLIWRYGPVMALRLERVDQ